MHNIKTHPGTIVMLFMLASMSCWMGVEILIQDRPTWWFIVAWDLMWLFASLGLVVFKDWWRS